MSATNGVAIVGGGPSGLTAAYRLARAGVRVVVFEAREWLGGRARTDEVEGHRIDAGAQLLGSMFTETRGLLDELGLSEDVVPSPGRDALWRNGRAHEVTYGSMTSMVASGGLSVRTKLRLGTTYLPFLTSKASALDVHAPWRVAAAGLDEETIAEWGRERMGREFLDSLVYPQLAAYYGALPEETSAGFYHTLAHYGLDVSVYALRGGMSLLCEALAARVIEYGGRVRTGTAVERAALTSEGARVLVNGEWEDFDALVMAVPGPAVLDLLDDPPPRLAAWLRGVRFRPALSIALLLERPVQARFFGLSFPRGQSDAVAAVCVEENKGPGLVPNGRGLLVAIARPEVAPGLLEAEPRAVFDAMIPDVERAFPGVSSAVSRGRVYRWPVGNPVFHPGYLAQLGELRDGAVEGDINLALAGDYLCSTSIEGAVTTGAAAAARITARLGSSPGASI